MATAHLSFRQLTKLVLAGALLLSACDAGDRASNEAEEAATATAENTGSALHAHLNFLADDLLKGRLPGTDGYDIAARYVASQFEIMGLKPAGENDGYFQNVPLRVTHADHQAAGISLRVGEQGRKLVSLQDFIIGSDANIANSSVTAPVVFAGFGVEAPEFGINNYEGLNVNGKIVLLLLGAPNNLPGEERAYFNSTATKGQTAARHGAVGMLFVHSLTFEKIFSFERIAGRSHLSGMTWMESEDVAYDPAPEIRAGALLSAETARSMFEGAPRSFDEVRAEAEEAGGDPAGFPLDAQVTVSQRSIHTNILSPNIIGIVEGSDPLLRDEFIVMTAHLDHDGVSTPVDGDDIYNGAVDNASGTAVLLEVARALATSPPRRSVVIAVVTAEEKGLLGAEYYVHFPTVPKDAIVANVNIDGGLFFYDFADVTVFGHGHSSLTNNVQKIAGQMGLAIGNDPFPEQGFFVRSDHYRFVQQGIPSIFPWVGMTAVDEGINGADYFTSYLGTNYHQPSDDMDLPWNWDAGAKFTRFITGVTRDIANDDAPPAWNKGDFFGDLFAGEDENTS